MTSCIGNGPGGGSAILRTQADEQTDFDDTVQILTHGGHMTDEWPNEAGFDGLSEERGPIEVPLVGHIPVWAAGSLYRTGPGVYKIEDTPLGTFHTSHWFDGLAHTHRFDILPDDQGNAKLFYSSRRQSDQLMQYIKEKGDRPFYSFGQRRDPCLGLFSKMMSTFRGIRSKQEDKWIENVGVVVIPNFPGLESASGNLVDCIAAMEKGNPETVTKSPISTESGGHRAKLPEVVWVTTDNTMMKQCDPRTLEPIGFATQKTLHPDLKGPMSCAHAQRDPVTGDLFNFNLDFGKVPTYRVFRVSASTGKTDILATIAHPDVKSAYIHSFYLSPSFVILCIPSSHIAGNGAMIMWQRNVKDSIKPFDPSMKCKWFVVDRLHGSGVVAEFDTDAGFFFHTINAFEEQDKADVEQGTTSVFCDVIEYPNLEIMDQLYYDVLLKKPSEQAKFTPDKVKESKGRADDGMTRHARYHFRISNTSKESLPTTISVEKLFSIPAPHSGELPTINPLYATKRHRHVYSTVIRGKTSAMDGIAKTDTVTREVLFWDNPAGHSPGEAIFVPRPGATEEDDGVLLAVVLDGFAKKSYLLCLNAQTMEEMGRGEVGFAIAFGFHGVHVGV